MSTLHRWREPVAWAALGISAGSVLLSLLRLVRYQVSEHYSFRTAANVMGGGFLPLPLLTVVVLAVLACALPRPRSSRAGTLITATLVLVGVSAVIELVLLVVSLFDPGQGAFGILLSVLGGLLSIGLKVLVLWLLMHLVERGIPVGNPTGERSAPAPQAANPAVGNNTGQNAPVWRAEDAVGTVWNRAGDAASGAAGQHTAAGGTGWQAASVGQRTPAVERSAWDPGTNDPARTHLAGQQLTGQHVAGQHVTEQWGTSGASTASGDWTASQASDQGSQGGAGWNPGTTTWTPATDWSQQNTQASTSPGSTPLNAEWSPSWQAPQAPDPSARASAWATADDVARGRVVPRGDLPESAGDGESTIMRPAPEWRPADDDQR